MRTVSATEAKNRLGALIGDVADGDEDVVIENHGTPRAVLISYEHYRELQEAKLQQRRREALDDLRRLRAEVRAQNQDLDEEAAEAIAEEVSREAISRVLARSRARRAERLG
jgi:prevent-host-death family protein